MRDSDVTVPMVLALVLLVLGSGILGQKIPALQRKIS